MHVAIVGSGFGGLGTALRLRDAGLDDFVVLERAGDVGGTWRDNSYPGCACDVESHLYSLSFAPTAEWTHRYSRQAEIWDYLRRCARDGGLLPRIRFDTEVLSAAWDESWREWRMATSRGEFRAAVLVLATGPLSAPALPALPGLAAFAGRVFHSARWDHDYDLRGRRVAVIGTGASAIQFVPAIQPLVARLHLFQRTPAWVLPRFDGPIRGWQRRLYAAVPLLQRGLRAAIYLYREASVLLFRHPALMRRLQWVALRHLRRAIRDPALRARLEPRYTMGCKRILLSNDYYPALAQPNVEVVTSGIQEVRAHSIVDAAGVEREVDAILLGTGFTPTDPPLAAHVRGRHGRTLRETWAGSPRAHLGTTVAGFPNLFLLLGPNTGLGHTSVLYMLEAQITHVVEALRFMRSRGLDAVEPRAEAQAAFVSAVDRDMRGTVWTAGGCASWYLDRTGRNSTLWPGFSWSFRRRVSRFRPQDYAATPARKPEEEAALAAARAHP
ncbi:MAG TPA: NAD(P)/FAD-dependent oxidoreductase [Vicinamibacteria bacterium]|nr:NAD(P)/FAD-dependent oxidoreductase [Vicinamibacteria bacterium]